MKQRRFELKLLLLLNWKSDRDRVIEKSQISQKNNLKKALLQLQKGEIISKMCFKFAPYWHQKGADYIRCFFMLWC